jgi:antibiotic biosynthesis monooxygenase (ABM) superfamily enzyme
MLSLTLESKPTKENHMNQPIHVAITRKVKPGLEGAFEEAIREFWSRAVKSPGSLGAQLIRPMPGEQSHVYGIIRSFASQEDHDAFYASDQFREWDEYIKPYVEPEYSRRKLHGLEAFFSASMFKNPAKWKMAIITWIGVWPSVYTAAKLIGPLHEGWPFWAGVGLETCAVVCALTWVVMPFLSKVFGFWLNKS